MNAITMEVAKAALAQMIQNGHFNICAIDNILNMTHGIPPRELYAQLRALHCVDYRNMSQRLRLELPRMIQIVIESAPLRVEVFSTESKLLTTGAA